MYGWTTFDFKHIFPSTKIHLGYWAAIQQKQMNTNQAVLRVLQNEMLFS